jgi:hypothetical protein
VLGSCHGNDKERAKDVPHTPQKASLSHEGLAKRICFKSSTTKSFPVLLRATPRVTESKEATLVEYCVPKKKIGTPSKLYFFFFFARSKKKPGLFFFFQRKKPPRFFFTSLSMPIFFVLYVYNRTLFFFKKKIVIKEKETIHKTNHLPLINRGTPRKSAPIALLPMPLSSSRMFTIEHCFFLKKKIVIKEKETTHKTDHPPLINRGPPPELWPIGLKFGSTTANVI